MRINTRKWLCRLLLGGSILVAGPSFAGPIDDYANGPWLAFSWWGENTLAMGCYPADPDGLFCSPAAGSVAADAPPWTFTVGPEGAVLTVVDVYNTGDQFEVFDHDTSIGVTSDPAPGFCGTDPDTCLGQWFASSGEFVMAEGFHQITIEAVVAPFIVGAAYLRIDGDVEPLPELDTDGDGVLDEDDACKQSDLSPTVVIDGCDSGVENQLFETGCTISDLVTECAVNLNGIINHGQIQSCTVQLTEALKKQGVIKGKEKDAINSCAAQADTP